MKTSLYTIIISITFLLIGTNVMSQNPANTGNLQDGFKIMRENVKGTPFLTSNWIEGYGIYSSGTKTEVLQLNYDLYGDKLVFKNSAGDVLEMLDEDLVGFILADEEENYIFIKIPQENLVDQKKPRKYFHLVDAPNKYVVVQYDKELDDPNKSGWTSSTSNTLSAEYKLNSKIFVLNPQDNYVELKPKNKALSKAFANDSKMESYLKQHKIEDLNDLVLAMRSYYSDSINN
ncbi:hypothetical protein [Aegicerativicinus sediminis]|uniref:hypothetical protein n=1 Tax=Aegicerativicinus sediminis TaxID=2893202 RepID=UPI001E4CB6AE|nr:hypothetical protein [Aegicerativicinus sediminis]